MTTLLTAQSSLTAPQLTSMRESSLYIFLRGKAEHPKCEVMETESAVIINEEKEGGRIEQGKEGRVEERKGEGIEQWWQERWSEKEKDGGQKELQEGGRMGAKERHEKNLKVVYFIFSFIDVNVCWGDIHGNDGDISFLICSKRTYILFQRAFGKIQNSPLSHSKASRTQSIKVQSYCQLS